MKYYAMIDGVQRGPFTLEEMPAVGVRPSTYIWTKGMSGWRKAEEDPDVCRLFRNHLYDLMHPAPTSPANSAEDISRFKVAPDSQSSTGRSRFDYYLQQTGETLPTLEDIDRLENTDVPPPNITPYAWLVTILCFFPTGIAAIVFSYRSRRQWKAGNHILAHGYCRSAKMWTGISLFLGFIVYAFLFALL